MKVIENLFLGHSSFTLELPLWLQNFFNLFFLVVLIVIYSVFIWKFYRFIATKNILELNLKQYNWAKHPFFEKLFAGTFYFFEYIVILPFLVLFWFSIFTVFLILLTEGLEMGSILVISAIVIGAIRVTTYIPGFGESLAKDLAKLLPFTLLAISITKSGFFDVSRIITHFIGVFNFLEDIWIYLLFIIVLEIFLRFIDLTLMLVGLTEKKK